MELSLWSDEKSHDLLQEQLDEFSAMYPEVEFNFQISMEGEDTCKSTIMANPKGAADTSRVRFLISIFIQRVEPQGIYLN